MSRETYWKSRTFIKRGEVKLTSSDNGFLTFEVGPKRHEVLRHGDGKWLCNAVTNEGKDGCPLYNVGKECSHVRACKMWLRGEGL